MGRRQKLYLLGLFLATAHLLYAPAWQAGWVRDVSGWIESLHTKSFGEYLLRRGLRVESLYPFTQAALWVWWKVFGIAPLPWHLLMVSLHAGCAWGWSLFYGRIFRKKAAGLFAGLFFLLSPYATEVVVWEAGYHYLQGMAFLLLTLGALIRYLDSGKAYWIAVGLGTFLPALCSLEVFYLTPVYVALLVFYFRENPASKKAFYFFVLPLLGLCIVQYLVYRSFYSHPVPHITTLHFSRLGDYLRKPAKYLFHLFAFGRYWPDALRQTVYGVLNSWTFLGVFYPSLLACGFIFWKSIKRLTNRPLAIPISFGLAALLLVMPLHFNQAEEGLVDFDRYAYFMLPVAGALLSRFFREKVIRGSLLFISGSLLFYTTILWRESDALSRKMLFSIPDFKDEKPTILLNVPNAFCSIPMIEHTKEGEAALMRRYVLEKPFSGSVWEPGACNISAPKDLTIQTAWKSPQSLLITQVKGGGWWTGGVLSTDWENTYFVVHFAPEKRSYLLTLRQPATNYHLLWWNGDGWTETSP